MGMRLRTAFVASLGLLLLVNGIVLAGVYWNRELPAESVVTLSERELSVSFGRHGAGGHDSVTLSLSYRRPSQDGEFFISAKQMQALGFRAEPDEMACDVMRTQRLSPREVLLVIEVDGPAYQRELDIAEKAYTQAAQRLKNSPRNESRKNAYETAERELEYERHRSSRAFVVDVGVDQEQLRERYSDSKRYAIVRATANPSVRELEKKQGKQESRCVHYAQASAMVRHIHVPRELRDQFLREDSITKHARHSVSNAKPFVAEIAFGKRLEPWLHSVKLQKQ